MENKKFVCFCCGYYTLESEYPLSYDICPVCFWEQDPIQQNDPNFTGGANTVSLNQAQKNYLQYGACQKKYITYVRLPLESE